MSRSTWLHELYDASYSRLVLQLFVLCGDLADAEDAVQEAFVKAIGRGRAFDEVQNPEAWLRTVASTISGTPGGTERWSACS